MKNLFKYLFMLMVVFMGTIVFTSCGDNDDDDISSNIEGTWKLTEIKTTESGSYISWPYGATYASFKSDGTYYGSGYFGTGNGTWSKSGNTVSTYIDDELFVLYTVLSVTSTDAELKMKFKDDGSTYWIKCKKQ